MAGELVAGPLISRIGRWAYVAPGLIVLFNLIASVQLARVQPPGITTQFDPVAQVDHRSMPELIEFLKSQNELNGYTNYWVSYPLAFYSTEDLVFVPQLPYHQDFRYTERDNRYRPYQAIVDGADRVAYITTHHEALDSRLMNGLADRGVDFNIKRIGPYTVFYALSERVSPDQLRLYDLQ